MASVDIDKFIDEMIDAVASDHDSFPVRTHIRRDPNSFRMAVRPVVERHLFGEGSSLADLPGVSEKDVAELASTLPWPREAVQDAHDKLKAAVGAAARLAMSQNRSLGDTVSMMGGMIKTEAVFEAGRQKGLAEATTAKGNDDPS